MKELETEIEQYTLDVANPVCPCCGAKLVLIDSKENLDPETIVDTEQLEQLEQLEERFDEHEVDRVLDQKLKEAIDELAHQYQFEEDDLETWKTNREVRTWIRLKASELHFVFEDEFRLDIDVRKIEEALIEKIREELNV